VTETPTDPKSLESQLDGVLTNNAAASSPSDPQVLRPETQAIDQVFQPPQPTPSASQVVTEQKELEDIFNSPGSTADSAALAQQGNIGQKAVAARSDEDASSLSRQGFDTAAPKVPVTQTQAQGTVAPPTTSSSVVDLSQSKQPLVPENLKTPQIAVNDAPEAAKLPITVLRSAGSGGFAAPGAPIFDCEGDRAIVDRLAAGLSAQEEAIRRTAAAMAAAKADGDEPRKQAMLAAVSTLLSSATTASNWAETVIANVGALKAAGISADASQFKFIEHMKKILEASNTLVELAATAPKTYEAGYVFGSLATQYWSKRRQGAW
jgi:hypothetical protein